MELGKLVAIFDADTRKFDAGLRSVQTKITAVTSDIGKAHVGTTQLTSGLGSASTGLSGFATSLGAAAGASIIAAGAISGVVAGIYKLAVFSAQLGGEIYDLSQKINFSAETLSSLKIAAELSGGSLASLSTSLGIFDRNMVEATDSSSEMSRIFKGLKIDTDDNEKALRRAFTVLAAMTGGATQTALAMKLFGRSGKEVLGIVKETNGNIDDFIEQMRQAGYVITNDGAKKADQFGDSLKMVQNQIEAVARQIGQELIPIVSRAASDISKWMSENQGQLRKTANELASVVDWVYTLGKVIASQTPMVILVKVVRQFQDIAAGSRQGWEDALAKGGPLKTGQYAKTSMQMEPGEYVSPGSSVPGGGPNMDSQVKKLLGGGGGGGGRRGGGGGSNDAAQTAKRIAELQLQAIIDGLKREDEINRSSLERRQRDFDQYATQYMVIEERRHAAVVSGLDKEQKAAEKLKKGRDVALLEVGNKRAQENTTYEQNRNKVLDERARILDQINSFMREQERDIAAIGNETNKWDQALQQIVETLVEQGVAQDDNILKQAKMNAQLGRQLDVLERTKRFLASDDLFTVGLLGQDPGGKLPTEEEMARDLLGKVNSQIGLPPASYEKLRNQMVQLGHDLSSVFGQSINAGFQEGIKGGLQSLAQGLLAIVQDIFLRRLAEGLGDILGGLAKGGSGSGGFFGTILKAVIGGAAGGAAGGGGGAGYWKGLGATFATGGIVPGVDRGYDSVPAMLTPGELVLTREQQSKMGQQQVHNHYNTINLPPAPNTSYNPRRSARQQADMILAALQGSQT